MTVADSVRIMSDEQLARLFTNNTVAALNGLHSVMGDPPESEESVERMRKEWLKLLKSEVPVNG